MPQQAARDPTSKTVLLMRRLLIEALLEAEEARTEAAYRVKPDSDAEADDWSTAGEFRS